MKVTAYDAKSKVTAYNAMRAEMYMMEGRSFLPITQRVKQGRSLKKDSINDSNVPNGLCNVTEGVPSLPPVDSQDTAYEPKSKVTDRYANRHAPGHARNNIKEGGSVNSNDTEGVLPSLPPVESQDTAYEPKSKVTDRYANRHVPGRTRSNIRRVASFLKYRWMTMTTTFLRQDQNELSREGN